MSICRAVMPAVAGTATLVHMSPRWSRRPDAAQVLLLITHGDAGHVRLLHAAQPLSMSSFAVTEAGRAVDRVV